MKEQDFEGALKKLEKIVDELENNELSLDDAIKRYEEGIKLSNFCNKKLQDIKKKIETLTRDSSGKLSTKPFEPENIEPEKEEQKIVFKQKSQASQKKRQKGEELLF